MIEDLRFYSVFLALLSGIIGLVFYYKLPNFKSKLIVVSIWISIVAEVLGNYFTAWTGLLNYYVYNFYNLIIFSVYIILLNKFKNQFYKKTAFLFLILFVLNFGFNCIYFSDDIGQKIITNNYATGVIFVIVLSSFYLIELYRSDYVMNYSKSVYFWFVLGILIFHVPFLPFMLSLNCFLIKHNSPIYGLIIFFLNTLMNACFILGFLCSEKKYNY